MNLTRTIAMALFALAGVPSAYAADMPLKAPVAPPAWTWSGFYLGAHVGYGWLRSTDEITPADAPSAAFLINNTVPTSIPLDSRGVLGGLQVGYNWQALPNWVFGIEADIAGTDFHNAVIAPNPVGGRPMFVAEQLNWLGTLRARLGFTPTNRLLVYGTGGLAYGHANLSTALGNINGCAGNNCQAGAVSTWRTGWAAGVGAEWAFLNDWTARVEYLHFDLGSLSHTMVNPPFVFVFNAQARLQGDIVRVGMNYRFGGPVVARY